MYIYICISIYIYISNILYILYILNILAICKKYQDLLEYVKPFFNILNERANVGKPITIFAKSSILVI